MVVKAFSYIHIYISIYIFAQVYFPITFSRLLFCLGAGHMGISHELNDKLLLLCNLCLSIQKMYI